MQKNIDDYDEAACYVRHKFEVISSAENIIQFDGDESFFGITESTDNFPWSDIAYSMMKSPENTCLDYDTCPKCGKTRIKLRFETFDERVISASGDILVCPFHSRCDIIAPFWGGWMCNFVA